MISFFLQTSKGHYNRTMYNLYSMHLIKNYELNKNYDTQAYGPVYNHAIAR